MATLNEQEEEASQGQIQPNGGPNGSQPQTGPVAVPGGGGIGNNTAGAATNPGGGANASTTPTNVSAGQQAQNGQGFTDVAAYLNANQSGGAQLGSQVASNLTNQYDTLNNNINSSNTAFNNSVSAGYTPENQQLIAQAAADPTGFTSGDNGTANTSAYQSQLNDTYAGPTSWDDTTNAAGTVTPGYGTLQGQVQTGQQQAGLINSQGGQQELVSGVENNPTAGISGLDALLLGGNAGAVQQVQAAAAPFAPLTNTLTNLNDTANTNILNAQTAAQQTATDALNAFTGANGTNAQLTNAINNAVTNAQTGANNTNNDLSTLLTNLGAATPQQLQELGITQDQYNQLQQLNTILTNPNSAGAGKQYSINGNAISTTAAPQTIDYTKYLTPENTGMINASTVATPAQYQELQAIQNLIGANNTTGVPINVNNSSYAGTAPTGATFDYNDAMTQLTNLLGADYVTPQAAAPGTPGGAVNDINNFTQKINSNPITASFLPLSATVNVVNQVAQLFCFHENSPVSMFPTGFKAIKDIQLGDETIGGTVQAIEVAYSEDLQWYSGVLVTSGHAVCENGVWIRVGDSEIIKPFPGRYKVYNLVTSSHRIWIGGIMFADLHETDNYEMLDLNESIEELNNVSVH